MHTFFVVLLVKNLSVCCLVLRNQMLGCFWAMQPHKIIIPPMLTERESKSVLISHIC